MGQLSDQEHAKGDAAPPDTVRPLFHGVAPAIFDVAVSWLAQKHAQYLERLRALSWSRAASQSQCLYTNSSCALLKARARALDYCAGA
eukprot:4645083-Amphidinium_carterae.1